MPAPSLLRHGGRLPQDDTGPDDQQSKPAEPQPAADTIRYQTLPEKHGDREQYERQSLAYSKTPSASARQTLQQL